MLDKLKSLLNTKRVLYFPGCITRYAVPHIFENYKSLLSDMEVNFFLIPELKCCGKPLFDAGYAEEFKGVVKKNKEILDKHKITAIITECPGCALMLNIYYEIDTLHMSQLMDQKPGKLFKKKSGKTITYHDPCDMVKLGIINEPRRVLKRAGYEIDEFRENRTRTFCCGAGGLLRLNSPKLASNIAKERLKGKKAVVTTCPKCYIHLKENSSGEVFELSELLVSD
jgi:Fe-S oxidoreductase